MSGEVRKCVFCVITSVLAEDMEAHIVIAFSIFPCGVENSEDPRWRGFVRGPIIFQGIRRMSE